MIVVPFCVDQPSNGQVGKGNPKPKPSTNDTHPKPILNDKRKALNRLSWAPSALEAIERAGAGTCFPDPLATPRGLRGRT